MSIRMPLTVLLCAVSASCVQDVPAPLIPALEVRVAPLDLPGVGDVCFDITVYNAPGGSAGGGDIVWSTGTPGLGGGATSGAICSRNYGNGAGGDITYIGPCDAQGTNGSRMNSVTLWVDGIYDTSTTPALIAPDSDNGWRNPCGVDNGGCTLDVLCSENEDTLVAFNLTVMRQANQGFFDVAVNFEDIFCSAKLDTCYEGDRPIELLYGDDATRDWTAVFGFACSAGMGDVDTNMLYGPIEVTCGTTTFTLDPKVAAGNAHTESGTPTRRLNYGVYRGVEDLACGGGAAGTCNKLYWNVALDLADLAGLGPCTLSLTATANDANEGFAAGAPTASGLMWPYIDATVELTRPGTGGVVAPFCQRHPLDVGASLVKTVYRGNLVGAVTPPVMCSEYDGNLNTPRSTGGTDCDEPPDPCLGQTSVVVGDVTLDEDGDVATFACTEELQGSITLNGAITTATFPRLVELTGALVVYSGTPLTTLSLPLLETAGALSINGSALMTFEVPRLERVTGFTSQWGPSPGYVSFGETTGLATAALPSLVEVAGYLGFYSTGGMAVFAPELTTTPRLDFDNVGMAVIELPKLQSLTDPSTGLNLIGGSALTTLDLPELTTVQGSFGISSTSLSSMAVPKLVTSGPVQIAITGLTTITFPALTVIRDRLRIGQNAALTSVSFPVLSDIVGTPRSVWVTYNPLLNDCAIRNAIIAQLPLGWTGDPFCIE